MSQENVEITRRALSAFLARDAETFVSYFDPAAVLLLPRNALEGGTYAGHDGVRRAIADAFEMWEDIRIEIETTRDVGDTVVVLARTTNVGKGTMPTVEYEVGYVGEFSGNRIISFRPYRSHAEALEAVGLSE